MTSATAVRLARVGWKVAALAAAVILFILFLWPVLMLLLGAFRTGAPGGQGEWTLEMFLAALQSPRTWQVTLNSIILAVTTSLIALVIGTFLAWVAVRTTSPLRKLMTPTMTVILLLPALFYALGWVLMTTGRNAPLNVFTREVLGIADPVITASWPTMILIISGFVTPVCYLFMIGPVSKLDASMEDAARISGSSSWGVIRSVTIPLLRPALFGVFALLTSYAFSAFEMPLIFGAPAGIHVFSTEVYTALAGTIGVPNYAGASTLSMILMVLVLTMVLLRAWATRRGSFATITGKGYRPEPRDYGRVQYLFTAVFVLVAALSGGIPLFMMIYGSFQPMFGVVGQLGLQNYVTVLNDPNSLASISLTVTLAAAGGLLAVLISLILLHVASKAGRPVKLFAALVTWAPAAIPGVVVGLALISAYMTVPGLSALYGTPWLLLIGFIVVITPIAARAIEGGLVQLAPELEAAARVSGATARRAFVSVVARLLLPSFLAGWFISGIVISGNLSLPVLLSSPTMQPAAVRAYSLYINGKASEAAALFLLLLAALVICAAAVAVLVVASSALNRAVNRIRSAPQTPASAADLAVSASR